VILPEVDKITWTERNRRDLRARLMEEADLLDEYETLILDLAQENIAALLEPALTTLAKFKSLPHLDTANGWPFAGPVEKAGFLHQLFHVQYDPLFWTFEQLFLAEITDACDWIIRKNVLPGELIERTLWAAHFIETGQSGEEMRRWACEKLRDHVWETIRYSDSSILYDRGIVDPFRDRSDDEEED
jgi:hypothetical protein